MSYKAVMPKLHRRNKSENEYLCSQKVDKAETTMIGQCKLIFKHTD